jgi:hypothetical protein
MGYDLMVFEPAAAPSDRAAFLKWFERQVEWAEPRDYHDPEGTSARLSAWFFDMIKTYPAMNGPFRTEDPDSPKIAGYAIGTEMIYVDFRWSEAAPAYKEVRRLATLHNVGFFDVSGDGEIIFPPD